MTYDQTIANEDAITVKTYYKECFGTPMFSYCIGDIVVNNIDNLMSTGFVNATIGGDDAQNIHKTQLFCLINPFSNG